jgi:release factor glutamine methyltransferase
VTRRLVAAGCVAAEEEAAELVAVAEGERLCHLVAEREEGVPLAWLTGALRFCGIEVRVERGLYVPRIQSEELARRAASLLPPGGLLLDVCTGCGAIPAAVLALREDARVLGLDIDLAAAQCAARNGVVAICADLDAPLPPASVDVLTAVAPYVPEREAHLLPPDVVRYEPAIALLGGDDGLALVRRLIPVAARLLRPEGTLLIEVGGEQDELIAPTLLANGLRHLESWFDEEGDLRGLVARRR